MTSAATVVGAVVLACSLIRGLLATPARIAASPTSAAPPERLRRSVGGITSTVSRPWTRRRRAVEARAAWPAIADEVGAGLRSGASLRQALEGAAQRGGQAGSRLAAAVQMIDRGAALTEATAWWIPAAVDPGERLVAQAVELAAASGHAAPLLFDTVADGLRERLTVAGEVRAQTAQARASAVTLSVLPLAFTALLALTDPDVPHFLFRSVAGWTCLGIGSAWQASGLWWMHRIVAEVAA